MKIFLYVIVSITIFIIILIPIVNYFLYHKKFRKNVIIAILASDLYKEKDKFKVNDEKAILELEESLLQLEISINEIKLNHKFIKKSNKEIASKINNEVTKFILEYKDVPSNEILENSEIFISRVEKLRDFIEENYIECAHFRNNVK